MAAPKGFYVYAHLNLAGKVFYIGKGCEYRAWSIDRHGVWHYYVREKLGGEYRVLILKDGMDEDEALDLEAEIIEALGHQLVNWCNPGRQLDYAALNRYHQLRDANRTLISRTRSLETSDPEMAVSIYREALARVNEYEGIECWEDGLVGELRREMGDARSGDVEPLERLSLLLRRAGRWSELIDEVDRYFKRYPDSVHEGHAVHRRREEARAILAGERRETKMPPLRTRQLGKVLETTLEPLWTTARSSGDVADWIAAADCCREAKDMLREKEVLDEFFDNEPCENASFRDWQYLRQRRRKLNVQIERLPTGL